MLDLIRTPAMILVLAALVGTGWGLLSDPTRRWTLLVASGAVAVSILLLSALAPDMPIAPALVGVGFSSAAYLRDRQWRRSLIRD